MGRPAFFVRTYGCPVHCPWCDSAGTWHRDHVPKEIMRLTEHEIASLAKVSEAPIVVITGGEPTVHKLDGLVALLHQQNQMVNLETSGAFEISGMFDWITLSPKKWKPPLLSSVMNANEYKIIVEEPDDIDYYRTCLETRGAKKNRSIWLHPEWSRRGDQAVLSAISSAVKEQKASFRAGWQLHKLYRVDQLDIRSMPPVPLGGDPTKGY